MRNFFEKARELIINLKKETMIEYKLAYFEQRLVQMLKQDISLIEEKFVLPQYKTLKEDIEKFLSSVEIDILQTEANNIWELRLIVEEISIYIDEYEEQIGIEKNSSNVVSIFRGSFNFR